VVIRVIAHIIVNGFALWLAAEVISGIDFNGDLVALLLMTIVFGVVNALIKPLVLLLTLPLTIITLGLFALVINALMLLLTSALVPAYSIDGFWPALLGSLLISIVSTVLTWAIDGILAPRRR
jgi:putative membrane protein